MSNLDVPAEIGGRGAISFPDDSVRPIRFPANAVGSQWLRFQPTGHLQKFDPSAEFKITAQASEVSVHPIAEPQVPISPSASAVSDTEIDVDATIDTAGHDGVLIERSTTSGSGFSEVADIEENELPYSDTGLAASTEYFYQMRTYLWDGTQKFSGYTAEVSAITGSGGTAPGATGVPTAVEASRAADGATITFDVSFTAPTEGDPPTSYEWRAGSETDVWASGTASQPNNTGSTATSPGFSVPADRIKMDDDWFVCVRARNGAGSGPYTCNTSESTGTLPVVPGNLKAPTLDSVDLADGTDDIRSNFTPDPDDDAADDYQMLRDGAVTVTGACCSLTEVDAPDGDYSITVRARNATASPDEFSAPSNAINISVPGGTGSTEDFPNEPTTSEWPTKILVAENQFDSLPAVGEEWTDAIAGTWRFQSGAPNTSLDTGETGALQTPPNAVQMRYPDGHTAGTAPGNIEGWDVTDFSRAELKNFYGSWHFRFHGPNNSSDYENQSTATKMFFIGVARSMGESANELFPSLNGKGGTTTIDTSFGFAFRQQQPVTHNTFSGFQVTMGDWHQLEIRLEINDIGSANGIVKCWIDDTLVIDESDYEFRTSADPLGFHFFKWNPTWGGSSGTKTRDDFYLMDHIRIVGEPI